MKTLLLAALTLTLLITTPSSLIAVCENPPNNPSNEGSATPKPTPKPSPTPPAKK